MENKMQDSKRELWGLIEKWVEFSKSKKTAGTAEDFNMGISIQAEIDNYFDSEISKAKEEGVRRIMETIFQEFIILDTNKTGDRTVRIVLDVEKELLNAVGIDVDKLSNKK